MGTDTPNILSRETIFLMGILKRCLPVEKIHVRDVEDRSNTPKGCNVMYVRDVKKHTDQLPSMEGASRHSVLSTEDVFRHSVTPAVLSTEEGSQMNCASISKMAESPETQISLNSGSNKPSLSVADLPLTQEKVESTYADIFQSLGKFPGEPYKLRLKPDAVPVKHRPRKVPVHLQDAFHEEVE